MTEAELLARTDVSGFIKLLKEHNNVSSDDQLEYLKKVVIDGETFDFTCVYREGGGEGEGEFIERVYEVKKDGQTLNFIRTRGFYDSYDGIEWGHLYDEVRPVEVKVIRYVRPGEEPRV
jgi:hypothetical protein